MIDKETPEREREREQNQRLIESLQNRVKELENEREEFTAGGIKILFSGKANAQQVVRRVKPRTLKEIPELSIGSEEEKSKNLVIEGDNLWAMVTLYQYHGKVDLILTDPPYNTGKDFRYNDRWDEDPNDEGVTELIREEDSSRHTKWMKFMLPRLQMMWKMLKPGGVLAICIDERELLRLGMMLNEIFGENNRIAIINWQKAYAPKSQSKHVSSATEYVLVYAKDKEKTPDSGRLERNEKTDKIYKNPDGDFRGFWRSDNASVASSSKTAAYAVQNPFTGRLFYPPATCTWRIKKSEIKRLLEEWGSEYEERDLNDGYGLALLLKDAIDPRNIDPSNDQTVQKSSKKAKEIYKRGNWPKLIFLKEGVGQLALKRYLSDVGGIVATTYWASEDFSLPELGSVSLPFTESGHSQDGVRELNAITGYSDDKFIGVKPIKLFKRIIQLWCPSSGLVCDPFVGSGTTGHVVLQLNKEVNTSRNFILIEQGNPKNNDNYCRTLLQKRLQTVITGKWADGKPHEPLEGGFKFLTLDKTIDEQTLLKMERKELIEAIFASQITSLSLIPESSKFQHLIAKNKQNEGIFLIWNGNNNSQLTQDIYYQIVQEAKETDLSTNKYHVYARLCSFSISNIEFEQIPEKILQDLGAE